MPHHIATHGAAVLCSSCAASLPDWKKLLPAIDMYTWAIGGERRDRGAIDNQVSEGTRALAVEASALKGRTGGQSNASFVCSRHEQVQQRRQGR